MNSPKGDGNPPVAHPNDLPGCSRKRVRSVIKPARGVGHVDDRGRQEGVEQTLAGDISGETLQFPIDPDGQDAARAVSGDAEAMERLWRRHRRWVAAILLAHKPRWSDLDDLLQDVAMSVVRKMSEIRDPAAVKPWLRTVALNVAHAAARSGKKRSRDVSFDPGESGSQPTPSSASVGSFDQNDADHAGQNEGRRLMELAAELPDGYREPLLLKAVHGLSYREIGQIMSLPETTIETRVARGRRQLRDLARQQETAED